MAAAANDYEDFVWLSNGFPMLDDKRAARQQHDRTLLNESLILASCLFVLLLSYIAAIRNPYMPGHWQVGCCGSQFWWSAVGAAVILVGCAIALFLRQILAKVLAALMRMYVIYYSLHIAVERWKDYASVDKAHGLGQSLLPVYRPLSVLLGILIMTMAVKQLGRRFPDTSKTQMPRPTNNNPSA